MSQRGAMVAAALTLVGVCACGTPSLDAEYRAALRRVEEGDYAGAARRLEAALERTRGHRVEARALIGSELELANLFLTYPDLGRERDAELLLREARRQAEEVLPDDDPQRIAVLERLGTFYVLQARWPEAIEPIEAFLAGATRVYGAEQAYRSPLASNLPEAYSKVGEREKLGALRARIANPGARAPAVSGDAASAAPPEPRRAEVARFPVEALYLAPNVLDLDRSPAYVHFTRDDMPLVVTLPLPDSPASGASLDETHRATAAAFREWETALRPVIPWFRLEFRESDPDPDVEVVWTVRPPGYLPARGSISHVVEGRKLRVRGRVALSTQPVPAAKHRVSLAELRAHAVHAFGSALGLPDCDPCDSMMSMAWLRRERFEPTDLDVRTFEALLARPSGTRSDGATLLALRGAALAPVAARAPEPAVLADLPMINTGRGGTPMIDVAREGDASFVVELDTGAADTVLTTNYARALGVSVRAAKEDPYFRDTVTGRPLEFWVTGQHVVGGGRGPEHLDYALLGGEYLKNYVVELDFERRRVRFLDPGVHAIGGPQGDASEQVAELRVPELRPYVELEIGNGSVWALVDTGAEGPLMITEEKATELGIPIDRSKARHGYRNVFATAVHVEQTVDRARVGPVALRGVPLHIALADESSVRVERWLKDGAIVGIDVLRGFRVRLDYGRRKMGLTPIAPRDAAPEDVPPGS